MAKIDLKKMVAVAALAATGMAAQSAMAATACSGTATKVSINGGSGATTQSTFFKQGFDVQCSNNVLLEYTEATATRLDVASTSVKGNQYFAGNSNGGAVKAVAKCAADPCGAADIAAGLAAASSL